MPSIDWSSDVCSADLPWAELLRQWSSFHPVFSYLPRKFEIAVIASKEDRAAMRLHDIGIELLERDGVIGAKIFAGGGMGRTPMVAPEIKDFVTEDELISYVEARSEEHTSELQSLMRISYAVFCLKKKKRQKMIRTNNQ